MKVALIGYGKMGKTIEGILLERGHEVVLQFDKNDGDLARKIKENSPDIAIEFSAPNAAIKHYHCCFEANLPVVSGTTGWLERLNEVQQTLQKEKGCLFYAPNFSIGVNIFFRVNQMLARLMDKQSAYDVKTEETHHKAKLDSPSGTAIRTAEIIIAELERKNGWSENVINSENELLIGVKREENVPGTHKVTYLSKEDSIELTHTAFSRQGFALGAVLAAEWICNKPAEARQGYFEMSDMLQF